MDLLEDDSWDGAARGVTWRPPSIFKRAIWSLKYRPSRLDMQNVLLNSGEMWLSPYMLRVPQMDVACDCNKDLAHVRHDSPGNTLEADISATMSHTLTRCEMAAMEE